MNISKKITEQKALTEELCLASKAYYDGEPIMSDIEFDKKLDKLKEMEKESKKIFSNSPTVNVGAVSVTTLKKVRHEHPALSLDKIKYKDREDLLKWLKNERAVMSWKCDGSTVVLTYDDGNLTSAVTRGDGEEGSDITHNARFFKGIPISIPVMGHIVVRGEAMMSNKEFEHINAEAGGIYENARNLATATIQMLDSNESRKREIIFKAFELVTPGVDSYDFDMGSETLYDLSQMAGRLAWLEILGFDVVDRTYCTEDNILSKIEEYKEKVRDLPYPTDGLVISYDDLKYGWTLGSTGHHPRWAIALKWTDETVTTTIRNIEWSVGKTGVITPVAVFDEVRLGLGSNVTRASLHNLSIMKRLGIKKNCKAEVYLANLIIPQIASCNCDNNMEEAYEKARKYLESIATSQYYDIVEDSYEYDNGLILIEYDSQAALDGNEDGEINHTCVNVEDFIEISSEFEVPDVCPVCGADTKIIENNGVKTLHCPNHDGCPAQQIGKLMNTFGKDGLFIKGLGESQMEDLLNTKLITPDSDSVFELPKRVLYEQEYKDRQQKLLSMDGWGEQKWANLMNAIEDARNTTLQKFLYALNIPLLGNDLSKKIAKFMDNDVDKFAAWVSICKDNPESCFSMITSLDGVGEEKARNIVSWAKTTASNAVKNASFHNLISSLKFENSGEMSDASLTGLTFVITGAVNVYKNRDEFKASVEARGGKVAGSVSKNTTALVNNDVTSTSGKNQKAKELGIEIISEDEFISRYGK